MLARWLRYALNMIFRMLALLFLLATLVAASDAAAAPVLKIPPGAQAGPGFNAEAAPTRIWRPDPGEKARSDAYFEGGYWLTLWDFLYGAASPSFCLSRAFRVACERPRNESGGAAARDLGLLGGVLGSSVRGRIPAGALRGFPARTPSTG